MRRAARVLGLLVAGAALGGAAFLAGVVHATDARLVLRQEAEHDAG